MTDGRMPDEDATLVQLLRADLPPARDPLFRLDVLARRERERFRRQLLVALTFGAVSDLRNLISPLFARVTQAIARSFVD
jgi:hypothetical protein